MGNQILVNTLRVGTPNGAIRLLAGSQVPPEMVQRVIDSGGLLADDSIPVVAAARDLVRKLRKKGGADPWIDSLMLVACMQPVDSYGPYVYGGGEDGDPIFDGVTTYAHFATLVGTTYTLIEDTFLNSGTLNVGCTINTAGYKLFCRGTFVNNGTIHCDGKSAALNVAGGSSLVGTLGIGMAGGAGHVGVGAGTAGTAQTAANQLQDFSGNGGAGGAGGAQAGGAGGAYTGGSSGNGGCNFLTPALTGFMFNSSAGGNLATVGIIGGGSGGGGGGSDNAGANGGGGGAASGVLIFHCYNLVNNGVIRAAGGAGGNAAGGVGNAGGGGGGMGGVILNLSRYRSGTGTIIAPGGLGGAPVGTGVAGAPGTVGHIHSFAA